MTGSSSSPADTYLVGGAALPVDEAPAAFQYDTVRGFQQAAVDWINDGDAPVGLLAAPTGGGKTAIIAALASASDRILCLYPTNALTEAQAETLREDHGLSVDVLTGKTLTKTGDARSQEVMNYATDPAGGDVVITNPDVLQAILQGLYFSPGSELLRFFAHFDAMVYDEFHYYDPLAASGLLMQIKVLSERGRYRDLDEGLQFPRVLLPSATPSQAFVDHVEDDLKLSAERIRSELIPLDIADGGPPADVSLAYDTGREKGMHLTAAAEAPQPTHPDDLATAARVEGRVPDGENRFRYPMIVNRWEQAVEESFEAIANSLRLAVGLDEGERPTGRAAVIFNSAARSNRFHQYLLKQGRLGDAAVKDNGYDTGADNSLPDKFAVLNTTSKGEVGLDFDLNRLVMVTPFTASDFVQRIGRAARHSPAVVDVFGLDDPLWPPVQSYPAFLGRVTETLGDPSVNRDRLRDLLGLRASRALQKRFDDDHYHVDDVIEDFADFPTQSRWRSFLRACHDAVEVARGSDDPFAPSLDRPTAKVVTAVDAALKGLDSLRGRSIQHSIRYPLGDGRERTEYDLITALRHYPIEDGRDGAVVLSEGEPGHRSGHYPGSPSEGRGIDLGHSHYHTDQQLREALGTHVGAATWRDTDMNPGDVERFLQVVDLGSALLPETIEAGDTLIKCSREGEVLNMQEREDG